MLKKVAGITALMIVGFVSYQNCAKVNFDQASLQSSSAIPISTFQMLVTGGTFATPVSTFAATAGQTYDFQISGSSDDVLSGLDNAQSYLKKVSGQCSGNSIYQPFTLDLTQAGTQFQFADNSFTYSSAIADQLGGCDWQICASTVSAAQACVLMTAKTNATTTTTVPTTTTLPPTTTLKTTTTTLPPTTTTTMRPTTTTTVPPTTTTTTLKVTTTTTLPPTTTTLPKACAFNGKTIASDGNVTAYQTAMVGYGHTCVSEVRTCSNGSLSGSYTNSTCSVNSKPDCAPSKVSLAYSCADNNGCREVYPGIKYESKRPQKLDPTLAVYYRSANENQFIQKVMLFGGQCPGTVSAGANGDKLDVTLKPFQYGGGGDAQVVCQNGAWVILSGSCDGNYGSCDYPTAIGLKGMVCYPTVTPNNI